MDNKPLIAFKVTESMEGKGGIVFAKTNAQGRRIGACEFGDGDFFGVECRRAPEFDHHAPGPVPLTALLEAGWWCDCSWTGRRLFIHDNPVVHQGMVFDSPWSMLAFFAERGRMKSDSRLAEQMVRQLYPFAIEVDGLGQSDGRLSATFTFPGGRLSALWQSRHPVTGEFRPMLTYSLFDEPAFRRCLESMATTEAPHEAAHADQVQSVRHD